MIACLKIEVMVSGGEAFVIPPAFVMLHCRVHFAMVVAAAYSRIPKDTIDPNPEEGRLSHSRGLKVDAL